MAPRSATLMTATAVIALLAAGPAIAHQGPPEGECVSVELLGHTAIMEIDGPADVEAWIKTDDEWVRTGAAFDGEYVPDGYRWVEDSATVTKVLPTANAEFRLAVWSTAGRDDSCYVGVAQQLPPAQPPPPPPVTAGVPELIPAVAPPVKLPPARVRIRKTGPKKVRAGNRALYRIRVTNTSSRRVKFTLVDRLPRDVVLRTRRKGWVVRGRGVRIPMVLKANQTRTMRVPVRVLRTAKGRRCNVAVVSGPEIVNRRAQTCARVTRRVGRVLPLVTG